MRPKTEAEMKEVRRHLIEFEIVVVADWHRAHDIAWAVDDAIRKIPKQGELARIGHGVRDED